MSLIKEHNQVILYKLSNGEYMIKMPYSKLYYRSYCVACENFEKLKYRY